MRLGIDDLAGREIGLNQLHDHAAQLAGEFRRSSEVARCEPLPGRARPRASIRQFMELAVNMPEQEPQVRAGASAPDASNSLLVDFTRLVGSHALENTDQVDAAAIGQFCQPPSAHH